jgi:hypothetical protein
VSMKATMVLFFSRLSKIMSFRVRPRKEIDGWLHGHSGCLVRGESRFRH